LDRRLEEAGREAKALLAEANQEAERLKERAKAELGEAVERLRREQAGELARALAAVQEETERRSQALRHQAELNREQALAWLVSRVTGRDPS
jgi:vacuolar-type H+-ATPase subunit E/Vma4